MSLPRPAISKATQVQVFERDRWLCWWCLRPVVFPPALKYLEFFVRSRGHDGPLAYYQANWRRDLAPLLDELGASVDHVEAHARGGSSLITNLATICAKCNARKGELTVEEHRKRNTVRHVKGKYGEPEHWDGLSALFLLLIHDYRAVASPIELAWRRALLQVRGNGCDGARKPPTGPSGDQTGQ